MVGVTLYYDRTNLVYGTKEMRNRPQIKLVNVVGTANGGKEKNVLKEFVGIESNFFTQTRSYYQEFDV